MYDVAVVGAGILGLATARELLRRQPDARVVVLEREDRIAVHQTGHNSGVIHAGIYYTPGSLKAQLCVAGARELYEFCDEHGVEYERCGKLIVALDESELERLDELERRALANEVPGIRRVSGSELREIEPEVAGIAGLHSPNTGIVDFGAVARAYAADVSARGASVRTGVTVFRLTGSVLHTSAGEIEARRVVACAGAWSDRLAQASGESPDPRIVPFRGGYMRLREHARGLVRGLIYPVPDPSLPFLGVHLTKTIHGEVWLGPSALLAPSRTAYRLSSVNRRDLGATLRWPGTWRMARRWWRTGLAEMHMAADRRAFVRACARYVPAVTAGDVEDGPAGIRAQAVARDGKLLDDFAFASAPGVLHVRNAPSPAATSSLAIAKVIADRLDATS
jgi:(S)-2-hydroxyglutarate dehydrogenase